MVLWMNILETWDNMTLRLVFTYGFWNVCDLFLCHYVPILGVSHHSNSRMILFNVWYGKFSHILNNSKYFICHNAYSNSIFIIAKKLRTCCESVTRNKIPVHKFMVSVELMMMMNSHRIGRNVQLSKFFMIFGNDCNGKINILNHKIKWNHSASEMHILNALHSHHSKSVVVLSLRVLRNCG